MDRHMSSEFFSAAHSGNTFFLFHLMVKGKLTLTSFHPIEPHYLGTKPNLCPVGLHISYYHTRIQPKLCFLALIVASMAQKCSSMVTKYTNAFTGNLKTSRRLPTAYVNIG